MILNKRLELLNIVYLLLIPFWFSREIVSSLWVILRTAYFYRPSYNKCLRGHRTSLKSFFKVLLIQSYPSNSHVEQKTWLLTGQQLEQEGPTLDSYTTFPCFSQGHPTSCKCSSGWLRNSSALALGGYTWNLNSKRSNTLFWYPQTSGMYVGTYIYLQITHSYSLK